MHIALLAGEASGDQLGAELMKAFWRINPCIRFDGVGGPLMCQQGFNSLLPIEEFSVMGITEIVRALPRLLRHKRFLLDNYQNVLPDAFIGIDYPEFNLSLEKGLKEQGIYTAHYVSPSVWAWREKRVHKIKSSCDLMLTLFDFEKAFYDKHQVPAVHCGHPLVDLIPANSDTHEAREALRLRREYRRYLAVLPGSRESEVKKMLPIFIAVVNKLRQQVPNLRLLIPAATPQLMKMIESILKESHLAADTFIFLRQGKTVMQASDAVLLSSGTAALEAMLLEKPMLVSYKVSGLTAALAKRLVNVSHFSLPNLLADHPVVPEFIQDDIDPQLMADKLFQLITPSDYRDNMIKRLSGLRHKIKDNAADTAASAIYDDLMKKNILG